LQAAIMLSAPQSYLDRRSPAQYFKVQGEWPVGGSPGCDDAAENERGEQEAFYRCRFCRAKITSAARMIEVNGSHRHVFANPHGKVFEIGCFALAPGCISHGTPTTECTWFAGCSWRFSLCAACFSHLGWKYESNLAASFFGLILANLLHG
jgi:hypothetical protein